MTHRLSSLIILKMKFVFLPACARNFWIFVCVRTGLKIKFFFGKISETFFGINQKTKILFFFHNELSSKHFDPPTKKIMFGFQAQNQVTKIMEHYNSITNPSTKDNFFPKCQTFANKEYTKFDDVSLKHLDIHNLIL